MTSGGPRITSGRPPGRPKGSKDKKPRARPPRAPEAVVSRAFLEAASDYAASGHGFNRLRQLAESDDERLAFAAIVKLLEWGVGTPAGRPEPPPVEVADAIRLAAERARAEVETESNALDASQRLILAGCAPEAEGRGAVAQVSPVESSPPGPTQAVRRWRREHGQLKPGTVEERIADLIQCAEDEHRPRPSAAVIEKFRALWSREAE